MVSLTPVKKLDGSSFINATQTYLFIWESKLAPISKLTLLLKIRRIHELAEDTSYLEGTKNFDGPHLLLYVFEQNLQWCNKLLLLG